MFQHFDVHFKIRMFHTKYNFFFKKIRQLYFEKYSQNSTKTSFYFKIINKKKSVIFMYGIFLALSMIFIII